MATTAGERRRTEILNGALGCFDRVGVSSTTIDDIRAASGASVGSIYHHLGGKDDIVAELYAEAVSAYRTGIMAALRSKSDPRLALHAATAFHVEWMAAHAPLARLMLRWDDSELSQQGRARLAREARRFAKEMGDWLAEGVAAGTIRELPPELYGALFIGPLLEYGRRQVRSMTTVSTSRGASELADAIWRSIGESDSAIERVP